MQQSTLVLFQFVGIAIFVILIFYYLYKKLQYMNLSIESLQNQILDQQKVLENQDRVFRQIFHEGGPIQPERIPVEQRRINPVMNVNRHTNPSVPQGPQRTIENVLNPILSMAPMMDGLMGVLQSIPAVQSSSTEEKRSDMIDENEINKELSKELEELKLKPIKEGRLDQISEETKVIEGPADPVIVSKE
jgi:predicted Holliday junction resolvase-like endonuclease